jgi:hypothetical protein
MRHETRPVTVRTRWLTIGEGGMSSPSPSAAEVLKTHQPTACPPLNTAT